MKFIRASSFIVAIFAMLSVTGCGDRKEKDQGIETGQVRYENSTHLIEGDPCAMKLKVNMEWPVGGVPLKPLKTLQAGILHSTFKHSTYLTDIDKAIREYEEEMIAMYREEWAPYYEEEDGDGMDMPYAANWEESVEGRFMKPYRNMISYIIYTYGYYGGAHGDQSELAVNFDTKTGVIITEENLFKEGYQSELAWILSGNLKKAVDEETYDMIFEKDIKPNGNFSISRNGLEYIYGTYEIGPYAIGITHVPVSWEEIDHLMK